LRVFVQEKDTLESARLGLQKPKAQSREMNRKKHSVRREDTKVPKLTALMRERVFCVISSPMLLERLPEVQSLDPKDKWRLIDELWCDLARQVEGEAPNANIVELLEKRFSDYLVDPSQGQSADEVFARLAEHKRRRVEVIFLRGAEADLLAGMDAIRGDLARAR